MDKQSTDKRLKFSVGYVIVMFLITLLLQQSLSGRCSPKKQRSPTAISRRPCAPVRSKGSASAKIRSPACTKMAAASILFG